MLPSDKLAADPASGLAKVTDHTQWQVFLTETLPPCTGGGMLLRGSDPQHCTRVMYGRCAPISKRTPCAAARPSEAADAHASHQVRTHGLMPRQPNLPSASARLLSQSHMRLSAVSAWQRGREWLADAPAPVAQHRLGCSPA